MRKLLAILALVTLTSCASLRKPQIVFAAPKLDCAIFDAPTSDIPESPALSAGVPAWQLFAWSWQAYAEGLLGQRVDSARCVAKLRQEGIVK